MIVFRKAKGLSWPLACAAIWALMPVPLFAQTRLAMPLASLRGGEPLDAMQWSRDGNTLYLSSESGLVKSFGVKENKVLSLTPVFPGQRISSLGFSPQGELVVASCEGKIRMLDLPSMRLKSEYKASTPHCIAPLSWSSDGKSFWARQTAGLSVEKFNLGQPNSVERQEGRYFAAAMPGSGAVVTINGYTVEQRPWGNLGAVKGRTESQNLILSAAASPVQEHLIGMSPGHETFEWLDLRRSMRMTLDPGAMSPAAVVAWSQDGTLAVGMHENGTLAIWSIPDGAKLGWLETGRIQPVALALSSDSNSVAVSYSDGSLQVFSLARARYGSQLEPRYPDLFIPRSDTETEVEFVRRYRQADRKILELVKSIQSAEKRAIQERIRRSSKVITQRVFELQPWDPLTQTLGVVFQGTQWRFRPPAERLDSLRNHVGVHDVVATERLRPALDGVELVRPCYLDPVTGARYPLFPPGLASPTQLPSRRKVPADEANYLTSPDLYINVALPVRSKDGLLASGETSRGRITVTNASDVDAEMLRLSFSLRGEGEEVRLPDEIRIPLLKKGETRAFAIELTPGLDALLLSEVEVSCLDNRGRLMCWDALRLGASHGATADKSKIIPNPGK